jgi:hypothetical protein
VASYGLRLETDEELEQRVEAKSLKLNRAVSERTTKLQFFSRFVRCASIPIYKEKFVSECNRDVQGAERKSKIVALV